MNYYNTEERQKELAEHVKFLRDIASLYPLIAPIIRHYDGKMFNIRFKNALKEADIGDFHVFAEKRLKYIEIYVYNRGAQYTLAQCTVDDMPDGKRIPADVLLNSARERRSALLKTAYDIENVDIDRVLSQLNGLKDTYNRLRDSLPYKLQDVYGIKHLY